MGDLPIKTQRFADDQTMMANCHSLESVRSDGSLKFDFDRMWNTK